MTREKMKKLLPIIQAWVDGKIIQVWTNDTWVDEEYPCFFEELSQFRIKPESKYRPFKTQKEYWNEMLKHQPFGWLKSIKKQEKVHIGRVFDTPDGVLITLSINEGLNYSSSYLFNKYTFADGTPFGIKE